MDENEPKNNIVKPGQEVEVQSQESKPISEVFEKDFDGWNDYKKLIEKRGYMFKFREGEIWNCYIGENIGYEECGKNDFLRPVFIILKVSGRGFVGIPLSTKKQMIDDWFLEIKYNDKEGEKINYLLLTQIRFFDAKRLAYYKGKTDKSQLKEIRHKIGISFKILEKVNPSTGDRGFRIGVVYATLLILILIYQVFYKM